MKNRNLVFITLLYFITLSIYSLYWLHSTRSEMVKLGQKVRPFWILFVPIFIVFAGIVGFALSNQSASSSTTFSNISIVFLGLSIISGIVITIFFISSYCKAVENVTKKELEYGFNFALAIILAIVGGPFIWMMLNQYHFNKLSDPKDQLPDTPFPKATSA